MFLRENKQENHWLVIISESLHGSQLRTLLHMTTNGSPSLPGAQAKNLAIIDSSISITPHMWSITSWSGTSETIWSPLPALCPCGAPAFVGLLATVTLAPQAGQGCCCHLQDLGKSEGVGEASLSWQMQGKYWCMVCVVSLYQSNTYLSWAHPAPGLVPGTGVQWEAQGDMPLDSWSICSWRGDSE